MSDEKTTIDRREAVRRVGLLLGGLTFVGGSGLLEACTKDRPAMQQGDTVGAFSADDVAFLDEVADTILPTTKTPGAKAAKTGAFMAVMVNDSYEPDQQKIFRDGMKTLDAASQKMNGKSFMQSTPEQRLALLTQIDKDAKAYNDAVQKARDAKAKAGVTLAGQEKKPSADTAADKHLPDQRKENAPNADAGAANAITADSPPHYFRMMKELTMLGYFTSEIGMTQAQRYQETPGRWDPCLPYRAGETSWAGHA
jgi:hypothetical protein